MSKVSCSLSVGWMAIVLAFGAQAQGTTYAVRLSDNSGAYEASLRGDQEKLLEISQTSAGGLEVIAKALYLRSLYRLDESSKTVSECGALSQISRSTANWSCAMILAGNKLLAGDTAGWARLMDATKKAAVPLLAKQMNAAPESLRVGEFETVADFSQYFDVPPVAVKRDADEFSIPIEWRVSSDVSTDVQPFITATINGHSLQMALDTGTSGVIIKRSDADALNISDIHHGWMTTSEGVPTDLGVIKSLSVGKVTVSNMPATITDAPVSVLGIRGLQFLRAVRLHGDTLVSHATGFGNLCQTPLDMTSWVEGSNSLLLVPGVVGGKDFHFFLDTGNAWGIVRHTYGEPTGADNARSITLTVGGVIHAVKMSEATDSMQIGSVPAQLQAYRIVYSSQHKPFRYDIGGSYVHQHDLIIDFSNGLMCVM